MNVEISPEESLGYTWMTVITFLLDFCFSPKIPDQSLLIIKSHIKSIQGCEQRAQLFSKYLIKYLKKKFPVKSFGLPKKHFIFGNLEYATENAQYWNVVNWGFHVVPIIKLSGCDDLFILDPSIRPTPVTKSEYHNIFSGQISGYVTCHSNTYSITDDCNNPVKVTKNNMKEERLLDM